MTANTERGRWLEFLYPEPDVVTVFVMNVTLVTLFVVDADLRHFVLSAVARDIASDEDALGGIFIVVAAIGISLWMPFARRDLRLFAYFSAALHALGLVGLYGYRILSALGADQVPIPNWIELVYATGWLVYIVWSVDISAEIGAPFRPPERRQREIARTLVIGGVCAIIVLMARHTFSVDPLAIYLYAVPAAALLHWTLERFEHFAAHRA
jgi:hypothetical protein